jgi:hypothetical protein
LVGTFSLGFAPSFQSRAVGVAHAATVRRFGDPCALFACPGPLVPSAALGVGQNEDPLSSVRSSAIVDADIDGARSISASLERPPQSAHPAARAGGDVFDEDGARPHFSHESEHLAGEP